MVTVDVYEPLKHLW